VRNLAWQARAACRKPGVRPEWFAPEPGPSGIQAAEAAKFVCAGCPVRDACLAFAMEVEIGETSRWGGIFGGLSGRERRVLRRAGR
jgi:WhiB family transcriptional regulator, redox-sensing transcriptional regulator